MEISNSEEQSESSKSNYFFPGQDQNIINDGKIL